MAVRGTMSVPKASRWGVLGVKHTLADDFTFVLLYEPSGLCMQGFEKLMPMHCVHLPPMH